LDAILKANKKKSKNAAKLTRLAVWGSDDSFNEFLEGK
jgi:hypothetical protein